MPIAPAPITSARAGSHGWRSPIAVTWRMPRAQIELGSASTPSRPSARGIGDHVLGVLDHQLAGEALERRDAALGVVAGVARVGRALLAGAAVPARAADGGGHEVALREAVAALDHDAEQLVAEDQLGLAGRRGAELAGRDLAVGAADADLERADQQRARRAARDRARWRCGSCPPWSGVVIRACMAYTLCSRPWRVVVTWLGQARFRFDVGDRRILVDPFFAEHEARLYPPLSVDEHGSDVDWLLVTHEHIDHLDPYSLREVVGAQRRADRRRAGAAASARCARRPRTRRSSA